MEVLKGIKVRIREGEVLRLAGYKGERPIGDIEETLAQEIQEGYRLIRPKAIYARVNIREMGGESITLDNGLILNAGHAVKDWRGSEYLGVALCTIDSALEDRVSELFLEGEYPAALMLDSVGSVAVDSVADYVNHFICQRAKDLDIRIGPRLSPGYGKWDLREQRVIFALLPGEKIGVSLNENCMMIPRKSVSFCVGMGKGLESGKGIDPCRYCGMDGCKYRRSVI
jgi:hypothetical protein